MKNNPHLLAYGIRQRMIRTIARMKPNRWYETQEILHQLHGWLIDVERMARRHGR